MRKNFKALVLASLASLFVAMLATGGPLDWFKKKPAEFECYKIASGGPWRECAPKLESCASQGCFTQTTAFCFKYSAFLPGGSKDALVCTPTKKECTEWRADRVGSGSCFEANPEEYP